MPRGLGRYRFAASDEGLVERTRDSGPGVSLSTLLVGTSLLRDSRLMEPLTFTQERARRAVMLNELRKVDARLTKVPPSVLPALGVYVPGRGTFAPPVWDDSELVQQRIVLSVLHTGRHYDDELSDESLVYRFPATKMPGYDRSDIEAGKVALLAKLPIFVIISPPKKISEREVRVGQIVDVDDVARQFLVRFVQSTSQPLLDASGVPDETTFAATVEAAKKKKRTAVVRSNDQAKFAFDVAKRYGPKCAFCEIAVPGLVDAAHVVGVADNGSDDPRNGLPLCKTHHAAFDRHLVRIAADGRTLAFAPGLSADVLGVTCAAIDTTTGALPHVDAVTWRRELFAKKNPTEVEDGA